jgi:TctA family transporter
MAKKGEAGRALGASLMSSLVGAVFGAFALALAIPIVRPLVLAIGSPEFFMLALLGVTFLASLSGTAVIRGLTAAALGLMIATVGLDPISGIERFTFDNLYLWDGIKLVPVTLGLFAIPEIIDLSVKGSSIADNKVEGLGGVMEGIKDTFRHWALVLRCSAIGTYIGIIPGMGGAVSQWVAYAHAVQTSPNKERFGKGAVEGVLGPGAANNSNLGGALVPTIAFGVPGSVTMAILLGAFIIQGLVPGPPMLLPASQGGYLDLTFSFVWIVVISNIITVSVCFIFLKQLARITEVRGSLVLPFLLVLVYLGGFAQNNAFEDLIVVLAFGLVGWVMVKLDWPRPPLLLGLVLGSLAEKNLFLATDNYGWGWVGFPGVLTIGAIILAGILYPVYQRARRQTGIHRRRARARYRTADGGRRSAHASLRLARDLHAGDPGWFRLGRVGGQGMGLPGQPVPLGHRLSRDRARAGATRDRRHRIPEGAESARAVRRRESGSRTAHTGHRGLDSRLFRFHLAARLLHLGSALHVPLPQGGSRGEMVHQHLADTARLGGVLHGLRVLVKPSVPGGNAHRDVHGIVQRLGPLP